MIDFTIDCPLFLRLGFELGKFGLYRISVNGVDADLLPVDVEEAQTSASEAATLLDFIRDARLEFPTSSMRVAEWLEKNDDMSYCFPHWFEPVVAARDVTSARDILNEAANALEESINEQVKLISARHARRTNSKSILQVRLNSMLPGQREVNEKTLEREAILAISALLPSGKSVRASMAATASHVADEKAKRQALQLFATNDYKNKTVASLSIAPIVNRAVSTVRRWLQGIDH